MLKGFFFDWDGTLVDSFQANYLAYKEAFSTINYELTEEGYRSVYGRNVKEFSTILFPSVSAEEIDAVAESKKNVYKKYYSQVVLNKRLLGFAEHMKDLGHKIALITNASKDNVDPLLSYLEIEDLFHFCSYAEDVNEFKPSPEGYRSALDFFRFDACDAIAFEDSDCGIEAAKAASIKVIKVKL